MTRRISILLLTAILVPILVAADKDDPWNVLKHVTHHSTLALMVSGIGCLRAKIQKVTDDSITVKVESGSVVTIERSKIIRVEGYGVGAIYSAESSWADVKGHLWDDKERLRVTTKDGKKHEGTAKASDAQITLTRSGNTETILKEDVAQVYAFTDRPASDSLDSVALEDPVFAWLDPELWVYMAQKKNPIAVRIYDSSMPEEDSPVECHI